ncbi:unnamed protein product [Durusdinium trenchii]|uniref:Uncharacterized protein n=1 Tax=Durusdinium trenchii TaxID=1381693 RepID=A0ABP0P156_9DINO
MPTGKKTGPSQGPEGPGPAKARKTHTQATLTQSFAIGTEFAAWKTNCIAESWASYATRSAPWFERQWQRVQKAQIHPEVKRFQEQTALPANKSWWVFNPKETADKFEAWLKKQGLPTLDASTSVPVKVEPKDASTSVPVKVERKDAAESLAESAQPRLSPKEEVPDNGIGIGVESGVDDPIATENQNDKHEQHEAVSQQHTLAAPPDVPMVDVPMVNENNDMDLDIDHDKEKNSVNAAPEFQNIDMAIAHMKGHNCLRDYLKVNRIESPVDKHEWEQKLKENPIAHLIRFNSFLTNFGEEEICIAKLLVQHEEKNAIAAGLMTSKSLWSQTVRKARAHEMFPEYIRTFARTSIPDAADPDWFFGKGCDADLTNFYNFVKEKELLMLPTLLDVEKNLGWPRWEFGWKCEDFGQLDEDQYQAALSAAKAHPLFADFWASECEECEEQRERTFGDEDGDGLCDLESFASFLFKGLKGLVSNTSLPPSATLSSSLAEAAVPKGQREDDSQCSLAGAITAAIMNGDYCSDDSGGEKQDAVPMNAARPHGQDAAAAAAAMEGERPDETPPDAEAAPAADGPIPSTSDAAADPDGPTSSQAAAAPAADGPIPSEAAAAHASDELPKPSDAAAAPAAREPNPSEAPAAPVPGGPTLQSAGGVSLEDCQEQLDHACGQYPDLANIEASCAEVMAALLRKEHYSDPASKILSNLASHPDLLTAASICSGTGSFEQVLHHATIALREAFGLCSGHVEPAFASELVDNKARYCMSVLTELTDGGEFCMYKDATKLLDDSSRQCAMHCGKPCRLPEKLTCFSAGFSCTSYSMLSKDATKNATAMQKAKDDDPEGHVASVTTFHACLDVVDTSRPTWAIFENVESIDREVDPDTQTNLQLCLAALEERGYVARSFLLDALWYGLPQSRRRVYIVCLAVGDREIGCSAEDFFNSVENLLGKLYMDAPPADEFLLPDDDPRVLQYLDTLKSERDKKLSKDEEKEERLEKWMALHMSVAEKRGIEWPLQIHPDIRQSEWFGILTERAKEVVGFGSDERERLGRRIDYCDCYHSANRYATSHTHFPICLPRTIGWSYVRQRLVLGRELMTLQGHTPLNDDANIDEGKPFSESLLGNLAGNAFAGNVLCAVIMSVLCSIRYVTVSEFDETDEIMDLVSQLGS